ncbi:hypothetical protein [Mucilaginibacter lacusdianchii]|uniref:hypothetical protein n=1 Tax=Mucilaginibacter lacusdianchii TaxID=2684211 RepID=UPI00131D99AB|nr:hypothetical protein [Mucilaginibacter sp. JXJ CY 39]
MSVKSHGQLIFNINQSNISSSILTTDNSSVDYSAPVVGALPTISIGASSAILSNNGITIPTLT